MSCLIKISLVAFLFLSLAFCNARKKELSKLEFYLEKGFISDTVFYEDMYFKLRIVNRNTQSAHLFFEKWFIPFSTENAQPQKKSGSIYMLDSAGNKLNELLLWPLYPNKTTVKSQREVDLLLKCSLKGLVNADKGARADVDRFQRGLFNRIKNGAYYYYALNEKGGIEDSISVQLDKSFFIAYREPLVGD